MRFLFCCEFYYPSVGGVQEVMRQIAERMVQRGHDITVVTTRLDERDFSEYNGVRIEEFDVSGNAVRGLSGEVDEYRKFVAEFKCDALLIKAAQQWTFDALWPVLNKLSARKIFIPCGFSGLYDPSYEDYFKEIPSILKRFDSLVFYATKYRDIDFAKHHGIKNFVVLPNGACENEFSASPDPTFRKRYGIPDADFVFLTVGGLFSTMKGHRDVAEAFAKLDNGGQNATLILNYHNPPLHKLVHKTSFSDIPRILYGKQTGSRRSNLLLTINLNANEVRKRTGRSVYSLLEFMRYPKENKKLNSKITCLFDTGWYLSQYPDVAHSGVNPLQHYIERGAREGRNPHPLFDTGWYLAQYPDVAHSGMNPLQHYIEYGASEGREPGSAFCGHEYLIDYPDVAKAKCNPLQHYIEYGAAEGRKIPFPLAYWIAQASKQRGKTVLKVDLPRKDLIQAFKTADLFVFASRTEYSPLVLFESAAGGTPFLSVPVGNAEEIAEMTGGGIICPAEKDAFNNTRVDPDLLAQEMKKSMNSPELLSTLGSQSHQIWKEKYTWSMIADLYEKVLIGSADW